MATQASRVRIVPLYKKRKKVAVPEGKEKTGKENTDLFEGAAPAPPAGAKLTYNGGALLQNVAVYTIFWGDSWSTDAGAASIMGQINQFFKDILVSPLIDQLSEYNVPGKYSIGHGGLTGTTVVTTGAPKAGASIDDAAIRSTLQNWIATGKVAAVTPDMLYFVYLGNKVTVTMEGDSSCENFCGYHDAIDNKTYYAVMPYPSCAGCLADLAVIDALTGTSSHELCESITDPVPPTGWYDTPNNMEIGDICAWTFKTVAGHNVQKEWSNVANACI